jgi:hypothetical protein
MASIAAIAGALSMLPISFNNALSLKSEKAPSPCKTNGFNYLLPQSGSKSMPENYHEQAATAITILAPKCPQHSPRLIRLFF